MQSDRHSIDQRPTCAFFHFQKQAQKMVEVKKPLFKIMPDKFVLEPYQTQSITLDGYSPM